MKLFSVLIILFPFVSTFGITSCIRFYKLGLVSSSLEYSDCLELSAENPASCKPQKKVKTLPNGDKIVTFEVIKYDNTTCREAGYPHPCSGGLFVMKAGDQNTCFVPDNIESGTDSSPGQN